MLSAALIERFRALVRAKTGRELSDAEASEAAHQVVRTFEVLIDMGAQEENYLRQKK